CRYLVCRLGVGQSLSGRPRSIRVIDNRRPRPFADLYLWRVGFWKPGGSRVRAAVVRRKRDAAIHFEWSLALWVLDLLAASRSFDPPSSVEARNVDHCPDLLGQFRRSFR